MAHRGRSRAFRGPRPAATAGRARGRSRLGGPSARRAGPSWRRGGPRRARGRAARRRPRRCHRRRGPRLARSAARRRRRASRARRAAHAPARLRARDLGREPAQPPRRDGRPRPRRRCGQPVPAAGVRHRDRRPGRAREPRRSAPQGHREGDVDARRPRAARIREAAFRGRPRARGRPLHRPRDVLRDRRGGPWVGAHRRRGLRPRFDAPRAARRQARARLPHLAARVEGGARRRERRGGVRVLRGEAARARDAASRVTAASARLRAPARGRGCRRYRGGRTRGALLHLVDVVRIAGRDRVPCVRRGDGEARSALHQRRGR